MFDYPRVMDETAVSDEAGAGAGAGLGVGVGVGAGARAAGEHAPAGDAAASVLRRLERIEALDRGRAPAGRVLGELRELVREAEAWARVEGDVRARDAVGKLREEAEGMS
jgi:hypothetical protein